MTQTFDPIQIHEEVPFEAERTLAHAWLLYATPKLAHALGVGPPAEGIHVVLSPTEAHEVRFPARIEDVTSLLGSQDDPLDDDQQQQLVARSRSYAHGVSKRAAPDMNLPQPVAEGDAVICVDVPTIQSLAREIYVSEAALLARVLTHELVHVLRRHIDTAKGVVHGYLGEGDAQRDTWALLTDSLAHPDWGALAQEARLAQVRLAPTQPPAYQRFGHGSPDTSRWDTNPPEPVTWFVEPPRRVAGLSQFEYVEVPVRLPRQGRPRASDRVVLVDKELALGPWVVCATDGDSHLEHAKDMKAVSDAALKKQSYVPEPAWLWLHLQRSPQAQAVLQPTAEMRDVFGPGEPQRGTKVNKAWEDAQREPLAVALEALAAYIEEEDKARNASVEEFFKCAGQEVPPPEPTDPFRD